jgi:alpha-D-ribose 1-methylphosphonate 5-triphosphate synthase subunit PhnG
MPGLNLDRQRWMSVFARADLEVLGELASGLVSQPHHVVRGPEIGMVMIRGRIGGLGDPFNVGEATVARCTVRLDGGETGHAYVLGRDKRKAQIAALLDALMQTGDAPAIRERVIEPLARLQEDRRSSRREKANATRVDFFTMTRGDD